MPCTTHHLNVNVVYVLFWVGAWGTIEGLLDLIFNYRGWNPTDRRTMWVRFAIYAVFAVVAISVMMWVLRDCS